MTDENDVSNQINDRLDIMRRVSSIIEAYVSNHTIEPSELPNLMQHVRRSLNGERPQNTRLLSSPSEPAIPIEKSITPDYIVCLEDGKQMKMLKRHLKTAYGMTPDQYRERWDLPVNYPMVAPNYSKKRQSIAKSIGLGHKRKKAEKAA